MKTKALTAAIFFFSISYAISQREHILPPGFTDNVLCHIDSLVRFSPRLAGSNNELLASRYVENQFNSIGFNTQIETFEYKNYEFTELSLKLEDTVISPLGLGFVPYLNSTELSGTAIVIDSNKPIDELLADEIRDKPIVTYNFNSHFKLLVLQPQLIIYLDSLDFIKLKTIKRLNFTLTTKGRFSIKQSQNVIAQTNHSFTGKQEIIIGAHVDSYRLSPGASDNASGVGVMIELARYLKSIENELNYTIKFIAFGAEEIGILGSRRYILAHKDIKQACKLYYNIDDVGGNGQGAIETLGGVSNPPPVFNDAVSETLSLNPWEGNPDFWRILPSPYLMGFITTVNHPDWFAKAITNAVDDSGYKINYVRSLGADQMSFSHAGIPSTSIGITCDYPHTPMDNKEAINRNSIRKAGEISIRVILNTNKP